MTRDDFITLVKMPDGAWIGRLEYEPQRVVPPSELTGLEPISPGETVTQANMVSAYVGGHTPALALEGAKAVLAVSDGRMRRVRIGPDVDTYRDPIYGKTIIRAWVRYSFFDKRPS